MPAKASDNTRATSPHWWCRDVRPVRPHAAQPTEHITPAPIRACGATMRLAGVARIGLIVRRRFPSMVRTRSLHHASTPKAHKCSHGAATVLPWCWHGAGMILFFRPIAQFFLPLRVNTNGDAAPNGIPTHNEHNPWHTNTPCLTTRKGCGVATTTPPSASCCAPPPTRPLPAMLC